MPLDSINPNVASQHTKNQFRIGLMLIGVLMVTMISGCNQRRYKPAKWRKSTRNSTLPSAAEQVSTDSAGNWSTLPSRGGSYGGTLPIRGDGSTLPQRSWSTLPQRNSTLPQRNWSTLPRRRSEAGNRNWSTLPNRGPGIRFNETNSTLPNWSDSFRLPMPQRNNWSTLPSANAEPKRGWQNSDYGLRGSVSTLPSRGNPLR